MNNGSYTPQTFNNGQQRRMNYSQDRQYNMNNYNNTIGMNRSMSNDKYYQNINNQNNMQPVQSNTNYNRNNNNNMMMNNNYSNTLGQQRVETEPWDKTKGPYGVRFDEMEAHMKLGQKQYKDDLEYLMSLKNGTRHGDMTQKEWEAYNRKLHYMNDRYAYGELDRINFMRGVMKGYEDEYNARKERLKRQKELEDAEERKKFVDVGALEKAEKEKAQEKKKNLLREQLNDLDLLNKKKEFENLRNKNDEANLLKNARDPWGKQYDAFKDNLAKKNNRIFGNASKYNNVLGTPLDPNIFNAKNDDEFNKLLAEQKARERNIKDPTELNKALKDFDEYNKGLKRQKEENKNRQRLYKEYLDNQTELDKLNKMKNNGDDMRPQLLMPAYYYPNLPEPVYHKARDSLLASKNQEEYFGKDMNRFFRGDAASNTLMDYEGNNRYLGDSKLRHNPITCPVNDYYYNKYVNKLKKESEIIPGSNNNYSRSMNMPRDNLVNNGQQIFK